MELLFNGMINQPASDRNSGHVSIILIFRIIVIATFIAFASLGVVEGVLERPTVVAF